MRGNLAGALSLLTTAGLLALALPGPAPLAQPVTRPAGWTDISHGNDAEPDYERLFAMDRVHEIRIRIAPADFLAMQEDLRTIGPGGMGAFRRAGAAPAPFPANPAEVLLTLAERIILPLPDAAGRARMDGFAPQLVVRNPIYVPVTVTYDGLTWSAVGMRFKGNSSLMAAARTAAGKIPFRLEFDRYEDEVPATRNQRFYGFEKLTFSSNYSDESMQREVLATEAFRDQGVPAARAAFYRIFVDTGNGNEYWGLYTMIEDPADGAMLDAQFGDGSGNLYKPEGPGSNWGYFDEAGFGKKTNESEADFSDVAGAIAALHIPQDDPAAWRAGLESRFDVDGFLTWLAVNSLIANWDSYGRMAHNYYLYGNPDDGGRLSWIPWDHNMSFAAAGMAGMVPLVGRVGRPPGAVPEAEPGAAPVAPPGGVPGGWPELERLVGGGMSMQAGGDFLHRQVSEASWPLIALILADEVYAARYRVALERALDGMLSPEIFDARVRELHTLVAPYVVGPDGERPSHTTLTSPTGFERSPDQLIRQMAAQRDAARTALTTPR